MSNWFRRISSRLTTSGLVRRSGPRPGLASVALSTVGSSSAAARGPQLSDRKSIFAGILEALHDSRRRQAAREIHRYRHLIQEPGPDRPTCPGTRSSAGSIADFNPTEIRRDRRPAALNSRDRSAYAEG
jgi:hypothetical protein